MKLVVAVLGFLGCMLVWALAEAVAELLGNAADAALAPARRRAWQASIRARWHWPLLLMATLGSSVWSPGIASTIGSGRLAWRRRTPGVFCGRRGRGRRGVALAARAAR
jgi:hypothetical protein